jgi:hypothetical protein
MQQKQKLESFMTPSKTGQQQIELVKASQCLSELGTDHNFIMKILLLRMVCFFLDHFTVDADFTGIDAVEKDLQFVFKARHDIQNQAQDVLENGLDHLVCYQIFYLPIISFYLSLESSSNWYGITSLF